jgi:hypothetical protein
VGIAWIEGSDSLKARSYESVYLRPFNFRNADLARRENAVQYMASPDYDWPRLRKDFPGEFENPVDSAIEPTGWVPLRVVIRGRTVQVYVGAVPRRPSRSGGWGPQIVARSDFGPATGATANSPPSCDAGEIATRDTRIMTRLRRESS